MFYCTCIKNVRHNTPYPNVLHPVPIWIDIFLTVYTFSGWVAGCVGGWAGAVWVGGRAWWAWWAQAALVSVLGW